MTLIPRKLQIGDTIGIVATGGPPDKEKLEEGLAFLEDAGFTVRCGKTTSLSNGYLAGDDAIRARDVMDMFIDPEIDAIFCARGGTGTLRILPLINFDTLTGCQKIFMGYSDTTCFQLALNKYLNWTTYYGPMVAIDLVEKSSHPILLSNWYQHLAGNSTLSMSGSKLVGGVAEGPLVGGCLTLIQSLCGTDYYPDFKDSILFFEEVNEDPYKIDRMLTQLALCGTLESINGVIIGNLKNCVPQDDEVSFSLEEIFLHHFGPLNIPVIMDLPFGHGPGNEVIPIGLPVILDGDRGTVSMSKSMVR